MKKQILALVSGCVIAFTAQGVLANDMPSDAMPMSKVLQSLQGKGYSIIKDAEYDNGMYKADAISAQGKDVTVKVDAKTGAIVEPKDQTTPTSQVTIVSAAQKVEAEGYHNIMKIKFDDNKYVVKAMDKEGNTVKLDVDASNGAVKKD